MELVKTKRLILRRFEQSDFQSLTAMMSDPETMQHTGFKKPQPIEKIRELLKKWQAEGTTTLGVWAVVLSDSKEFVGWSMLKITDSEFPELGYMITQEMRGRGYATELADALLKHAFSNLKVMKVLAVTSPRNFASIKVLEKIGMSRVGQIEPGSESVRYECNAMKPKIKLTNGPEGQ